MEDLPRNQPDLIHSAFGPISVSTNRACHQTLPAETIPTERLEEYYKIRAESENRPGASPYKLGWFFLEKALASNDADLLLEARTQIEEWQRKTKSLGHYYEAATVIATLPAFEDRIRHGAIQPGTASRVLDSLTGILRSASLEPDNDPFRGEKAQLCTGILGAYRAAATGNPEDFLFPTSPREGKGTPQETGIIHNHDYYLLNQGEPPTKIPVESKIHRHAISPRPGGHRAHYAPEVLRINFSELIAEAIAAYPSLRRSQPNLHRSSGTTAEVAAARLEFFIDHFLAGDTRATDAVARQFGQQVDQHKRIFPQPKLEIDKLAESNTPDALVVSIGSLATQLDSVMQLLEAGRTIPDDTLLDLEIQLGELTTGSGNMDSVLEALALSRQKFGEARLRIEDTRVQITNYTEDIGANSDIET
ncbi:MAG TPA: hypothetical protein VMR45_03430 [Patescibacteria group bacterium]|nr:hypothetical protein [Patescibacteria group bacterium]